MPACKTEPVISDPPMEQWSMLQFPWSGEVQTLYALNMPGLRELYCDYSPITSLPWNDLRNVNCLGIYGCLFDTLELWRLTNLNYCYAGDNFSLLSVEACGNTSLIDLDLYYCSLLAYIDVSGCINLSSIYAYACAMPQAMVDQLLADLVTNGGTNGYLQINGGNNSPPSEEGLVHKAILLSRGWNITTN